MFDPQSPNGILKWTEQDLASLPPAEDDLHEYKSSATKDGDLLKKIAAAASGFWNSGGGVFIAGVNGAGQPDDGIASTVGRQDRRDWVDQAIHRVMPTARYWVHLIPHTSGSAIASGNCVLLVGFAESRSGPHMAPDNVYYVRAGAHTVPASHFLVEAVRARRAIEDPVLSIFARPSSESSRFGQLVIANLTSAPAINVEVEFTPAPPLFARGKTQIAKLVRASIDRQTPLVLDVTFVKHQPREWMGTGQVYKVRVTYSDLLGHSHAIERDLDLAAELGPPPVDDAPLDRIAANLAHIDNRLQMISQRKQG